MACNSFGSTIPLSKTTKFIVDNRGKTAPTAETGIALIATNCVTNDHLYPSREKIRFVSQETYNSWFRAHPKPGDILLTNKGSQNGAICLVPDPVDFVIAQDMVALRPNEAVIDPLYLFAALRSPIAQQQIKNLDVSGVIPHFKKKDFDKLLIPYPDRRSQEAIGLIYFEICRKIELDTQTNETLGAITRAIFDSWFVDFDPVLAKANGRQPEGMDLATAALFPQSFEDSDLGFIPKGWTVVTMRDIAAVIDCLHSKKPDRLPFGSLFLQLGNIANNGLLDLSDAYYISDTDYEKWTSRLEASQGDCVITNVGRVGAVAQIPAGTKAALGRNMTALRCHDHFPYPTFLIELLTSSSMRDEIAMKTDSGTILDSLNVRNIPNLRLVQPPTEILKRWEEVTRSLRYRMEVVLSECRAMAKIRDTLLPRLMSGKLRVPEAEKLLEAVL